MPDRYVIAPAASPMATVPYQWCGDYTQTLGGETIYEPDDTPIPSGLLDAYGRRLFRYPVRNPIGFDLTKQSQQEA